MKKKRQGKSKSSSIGKERPLTKKLGQKGSSPFRMSDEEFDSRMNEVEKPQTDAERKLLRLADDDLDAVEAFGMIVKRRMSPELSDELDRRCNRGMSQGVLALELEMHLEYVGGNPRGVSFTEAELLDKISKIEIDYLMGSLKLKLQGLCLSGVANTLFKVAEGSSFESVRKAAAEKLAAAKTGLSPHKGEC